uniref:M96 mating-specific protein family n=1 Tax=Hyaloperonospora arabidopsidis (strain Emoy2) TaxID=559515 RepID=M4BU09_HYAAE
MRNSCSDYTSTDTESVRSSAPSPSHTDAIESIRTRDAIRRSTYRKKQKAQRTALHDQVKTLSSQLALLQKRVNGTIVQGGPKQDHLLMWKALADRQLQAKLLAEEQHGRYLEAVEHQSMLIQELGALVRKRIRDEQQEGSGSCLVKKARCESPDRALYETYIKKLDEVYAQTDRILEASAVNTSLSTSDENDELKVFYLPSKRAVKDATYHEFVGKSTTPFSFDRVQAHIDSACRLDKLTGRTEVLGDWIPNNTTILKYQGSVPGCRGKIVQLHVARKYFEGRRIVIVWKKFTEGEGDCAGMHADETGWCVLQPSFSSVEGCAGTQLESVTRFVPMNFSFVVSGAKEKLFTDAIIKAEEEMCQTCLKTLEEVLLDDTVGVC